MDFSDKFMNAKIVIKILRDATESKISGGG